MMTAAVAALLVVGFASIAAGFITFVLDDCNNHEMLHILL